MKARYAQGKERHDYLRVQTWRGLKESADNAQDNWFCQAALFNAAQHFYLGVAKSFAVFKDNLRYPFLIKRRTICYSKRNKRDCSRVYWDNGSS